MTTPVDGATARGWWDAGDWDRLAPFLDGTARRAVQRYAVDPDVLDDLAQDTLARCLAVTDVPDHPGHFAARIARNLYLDRCKRRSTVRECTGVAAEIALAAHDDATPDALTQVIAASDRDRLRRAIRLLPDAMRRPLVLQAFHGRTIPDLAAQFACDEGAMKMRLVRARTRLATAYRRLSRTRDPVPPRPAPSPVAPTVTLSVHARFAGYLDIGTARLFDVPLAPSRLTPGSR